MTLNIFTIVLDGYPWLGAQFASLARLKSIDWHWSICEGAALPKSDTSWMDDQKPKVSHDGTHQFLMALSRHPRITVKSNPSWDGKTEQVNAAIASFRAPGVLLQMDCDEIWTANQLELLVKFFAENADVNSARIAMDYLLGPNIVSTSVDGYGNRANEWLRAWRYSPGWWMDCHEPPVFSGNQPRTAEKRETFEALGSILHASWVTPQQVAQKQRIYGKKYSKADEQWVGLQENREWPVDDLERWLPWVGKGASADRIFQ